MFREEDTNKDLGTRDKMMIPEDEVTAVADALLVRAAVNKEIVMTDAERELYASRSDRSSLEIRERREAAAKVFEFANRRLEDNHEVITELEGTIREADKAALRARNEFHAEEAAQAAQCASEFLEVKKEIDDYEAQLKASRNFEEAKSSIQAEIAALEAMIADIERQRAEARNDFVQKCERDREALRCEVEAAAVAAAADEREKTKEVNEDDKSKTTTLLLARHQKTTNEFEIHSREIKRISHANEEARTHIEQLQGQLRAIRSDHQNLAKRASLVRRSTTHLVDDDDAETSTLSNEVPLTHQRHAPGILFENEDETSQGIEQRLERINQPEILAILDAVSKLFPKHGIEHFDHVANMPKRDIDNFVDHVLSYLHEASQFWPASSRESPCSYTRAHTPQQLDGLSWTDDCDTVVTPVKREDAILFSPSSSVLHHSCSHGGVEEDDNGKEMDMLHAGSTKMTLVEGSTVQLPRIASVRAGAPSTLSQQSHFSSSCSLMKGHCQKLRNAMTGSKLTTSI